MSDKLTVVAKNGALHIPTADELMAGLARLADHVSVYHDRSDDMFTAGTTYRGQYVSGRGISPRQALWALAKMMNAIR